MILLNISQLQQVLLYSLIGVLVVFSALVILVFAFKLMGKISRSPFFFNRKKKKAVEEQGVVNETKSDLTGYEVAAISMALHLFFSDVHDEESNIITIKRIERRYSHGIQNLWSNKFNSIIMKKFKFTIDGDNFVVRVRKVEDSIASIEVNGTPYKVHLHQEVKTTKLQLYW